MTLLLVLFSYILFLGALEISTFSVVNIGGLFDWDDAKQRVAFHHAVDIVNRNQHLLSHARMVGETEMLQPDDSFRASRKVCSLLKNGVTAIFGPQSPSTSSHVQSICDALEVPHIENRWDYRLKREAYSVNLYPHPSSLDKAYSDVLRTLGWSKLCAIYENNEGLIRIQNLLKTDTFRISLRQLANTEDHRPMLKNIKKAGFTHIVLDVEYINIIALLKQAQQVGMMTSYFNYFITSLDLQTLDLIDFTHDETNITSLRLVDPNSDRVRRILSEWAIQPELMNTLAEVNESNAFAISQLITSQDINNTTKDSSLNHSLTEINRPPSASALNALRTHVATKMTTEIALLYDAVHLFAKALDDLDRSRSIEVIPLDCEGDTTWIHGTSIINYMKWVQINGLTGLIRFDAEGFRKEFTLDVVQLRKNGLTKVGRWELATGVNYTRSYTDIQRGIKESLQNKTLVVSVVMTSPYAMFRETSERMIGNDRYEGFCIDLIDEIAKNLGFNYTIEISPDGNHGKYLADDDRWDGMIGELLEQRADLAIGDLTITYEREQVVDFTMPWMNLGITILYRKPTKQPPNLFSFLSPLSLDVWLYMATAYLAISVLLFVLARFSPYEWTGNKGNNTHQPQEGEEGDEFSLLNCLWFCIGSLMQQGGDLLPKAVSTRIVAGIWWFFTLIMISSYTANLAAFLTVERMVSPIESAEDLASQTKIKYGSLYGGSTWTFFSTSKMPTYQRMFNFMESQRPSVYSKNNDEGVQRVLKSEGQYAFLMESSSIEYITERMCDLTKVGGLLDSKSYGIALQPGSPYTDAMSGAILSLQEKGILADLKTKWWKRRKGGGSCKDDESKSSSKANELGLNNVGGVFVVLLAGMGLASVVAVCEFVWKSRKLATQAHASVWTEMAREIKCALSCQSEKKPKTHKISQSPSLLNRNDKGKLQVPPNFLPMETYGPDLTPSGNYSLGSESQNEGKDILLPFRSQFDNISYPLPLQSRKLWQND